MERLDLCAPCTGCAVLDDALARASRLCTARGLRFFCAVDGAALSAVEPAQAHCVLNGLLALLLDAAEEMHAGQNGSITLKLFAQKGFCVLDGVCQGGSPLGAAPWHSRYHRLLRQVTRMGGCGQVERSEAAGWLGVALLLPTQQ